MHVQWILESPQKLCEIRRADAFEHMPGLSCRGDNFSLILLRVVSFVRYGLRVLSSSGTSCAAVISDNGVWGRFDEGRIDLVVLCFHEPPQAREEGAMLH